VLASRRLTGRGIAGAGLVARDYRGKFIAAACRKYSNIRDPFTIELIACRDTVLFAKDRGSGWKCRWKLIARWFNPCGRIGRDSELKGSSCCARCRFCFRSSVTICRSLSHRSKSGTEQLTGPHWRGSWPYKITKGEFLIAEWWCYTSTQREITIGSTCEDERELSLAKALEAGIKSAPEDVSSNSRSL
jgi:hypothetical protein